VDFDLRPGEVHAVVGENGAGKSTLMPVLAGAVRPDAGTLTVCGVETTGFADERAARRAGVGIVYQERSPFGPLSAAENVCAGRYPRTRWGTIVRPKFRADASKLLASAGLDMDPDEINKNMFNYNNTIFVNTVLLQNMRVLYMDGLAAALSDADAERLPGLVRGLTATGVGVVYISHRLAEAFRLADRVTVLKDGAGLGTFAVADVTPAGLVARMVGREIDPHRRRPDAPAPGDIVLSVDGLCDEKLRGVSPTVRAGEVVALAGPVGAGRTESALGLFGARPARGAVTIAGRSGLPTSPADAIRRGRGYAHEDRKDAGLFADLSAADNALAGRPKRPVEELLNRLRVVCRGPGEPVRNLSGGNQQKVILARWLLAEGQVVRLAALGGGA
jgi:ABC-type sugar transport system ATPase subunit